MATFTRWLSDQENRPQADPIGWLARQWKAAEGSRPRVSSPTGVAKHLATLAPDEGTGPWLDYLTKAIDAARAERSRELLKADASGRHPTGEELARFRQANQDPAATGAVREAYAGEVMEPGSGGTPIRDTDGQIVELPPGAGSGAELSGEGEIRAMPAAGEVLEIRSGYQELNWLTEHFDQRFNMIETVVLAIAHRVGIRPEDLAAVGASFAEADAAAETITGQVDENDLRLAAMGPQIDPATGQDRRYQGASPEDIAAAEELLAGQQAQLNGFAEWWNMTGVEGGPEDG
jgi:hypothetical protein